MIQVNLKTETDLEKKLTVVGGTGRNEGKGWFGMD